MRIYATFIVRPYDPDVPELIQAWDEYSFDNNPEGYKDTLQAELAAIGDEVLAAASVEIEVDANQILEVLRPHASITGRVVRVTADDPASTGRVSGSARGGQA